MGGVPARIIPTRSPRSRASFRCPPPDNPELSMRIAPRAAAACIVLALAVLPAVAQQAPPSRLAASLFDSLRWRHIGPEGNRFSAAAGIPGNTRIYYVGAASGGVYKTTDGGVHWAAIFDDQPVQSIGSLAVAESDPNIVWAGTGEGKIRSHISVGQGVYKSTDAGATWKLMGLEKTGRIPRTIVHPSNPDIVYVCALGHSYGDQPERGVYRTTDGGLTWTRTLFVDEKTGCSRSEERRVGKECRSWWSPYQKKKKNSVMEVRDE